MTESELMTIGEFARSTALTPSALRFYADSGVLVPASIADVSGYRYYSHEQVDRAVTLRQLREIGMPLTTIVSVLEQDSDAAAALVESYVEDLERQARRARQLASVLELPADATTVATVDGPIFAAAVDQILTATARHEDTPTLSCVLIEVLSESIILTATDRYRLSTRTLASVPNTEWSASIRADDLRLVIPDIRTHHRVRILRTANGIRFHTEATTTQVCRILAAPFPDYRSLIASLPETTTRVTLRRNALIRAVEDRQDGHFRLATADGSIVVSAPESHASTSVAATVEGPPVELCFSTATMYPAISTALGPDLMLDISGPDLPVVVRSADDGDLTTLAMPVDKEACA